jgi:hypothetical protein
MVVGIAVSGMHYMRMAAMRMYRARLAGMVMGGSDGATTKRSAPKRS